MNPWSQTWKGILPGCRWLGLISLGLVGQSQKKKQDAVSTLWVHHLQGQALELSAMQDAWQAKAETWA